LEALASISIGGIAGDNTGISEVSWTRSAVDEPTLNGTATGTTTWTASNIALADDVPNVITITAFDLFNNQSSVAITVTREPAVTNVAEDLSQDESDVDPLDLDGDNYANEDETACGSDPNNGNPDDADAQPANLTGASYPTDENDPNFDPDRVVRDVNGTIIGARLWPDCLNPDDDVDGLPDVWEEQYFGSTTAANPENDDDLDDEGLPAPDGFTNLQEYQNGTDPLVPQIAGFTLEVVNENYATWLPVYQSVLEVRATWTGGGTPPGQVWFSLKDTTQLPGRAINDPDPALFTTSYPAGYEFNGYDFGLSVTDPGSNGAVHTYEQGPVSIPEAVTGTGTYTIYLQCNDFGAKTRLVAGDAEEDPINYAETWLPNGSNINGIGLGWQHDNNPNQRLNPNADIDAIIFDNPGSHSAPNGDDFNNFEEYRGIIYTYRASAQEAIEYRNLRLNPHRMNLFVRAIGFDEPIGDPYRPFTDNPDGTPRLDNYYPFRMGLALQNTGVDVHNTTSFRDTNGVLLGWGHDATEDGSFSTYYRQGSITNISGSTVTGNENTGWATKWPLDTWEFKLEGDPDDAWVPVFYWNSSDSLFLTRPYVSDTSDDDLSGDYLIRMSLPHINELIIWFDEQTNAIFSSETGHIRFGAAIPPSPGPDNLEGSRHWSWSTKGLGRKALEAKSYGLAQILKIPLDRYFDDHPYQKGSIWDWCEDENGVLQRCWRSPDTTEASEDMKLSPLSLVEDSEDSGAHIDGYSDVSLGILLGNTPNGDWDGDRRYADSIPPAWAIRRLRNALRVYATVIGA